MPVVNFTDRFLRNPEARRRGRRMVRRGHPRPVAQAQPGRRRDLVFQLHRGALTRCAAACSSAS